MDELEGFLLVKIEAQRRGLVLPPWESSVPPSALGAPLDPQFT